MSFRGLPDTPLLRRDLSLYLTAVQCADACVGKILQALREGNRLERTLVIFTSDQGYCYHRAKATAYDMGLHVPLVMNGPGVRRGLSNHAQWAGNGSITINLKKPEGRMC